MKGVSNLSFSVVDDELIILGNLASIDLEDF
jgi:hypothetical protein